MNKWERRVLIVLVDIAESLWAIERKLKTDRVWPLKDDPAARK